MTIVFGMEHGNIGRGILFFILKMISSLMDVIVKLSYLRQM